MDKGEFYDFRIIKQINISCDSHPVMYEGGNDCGVHISQFDLNLDLAVKQRCYAAVLQSVTTQGAIVTRLLEEVFYNLWFGGKTRSFTLISHALAKRRVSSLVPHTVEKRNVLV
jgi:hypothetical protein